MLESNQKYNNLEAILRAVAEAFEDHWGYVRLCESFDEPSWEPVVISMDKSDSQPKKPG
jgi:hypothetical protein